jgi:hypothetical protein
MGISFHQPEIVRLQVGDGDYIDIKKRLSHGESEAMLARMAPRVTPGEQIQVETKEMRIAKVLTYLLNWSSTVPIGPHLPDNERVDTLNNLDAQSFDEIATAIDAHETAMTAARAEEKKRRTGENGSSPSSPSPSDVIGTLTGSMT